MSSTNNTLDYPFKHEPSLWERVKLAWRLVRYGSLFQAPREWYSPLNAMVSNRFSECAERAVEKSERECAHTQDTRDLRRKEALQWLRVYAIEAGLGEIQPHIAAFLIEWWVLRKKGVF